MIFADFWNVILNIWWNNWWAQGNVYLMAQTFYMITTSVFAVFLMFEINVILKWAKMTRVLVLITAIVWNLIYFFTGLEWAIHILSTNMDDIFGNSQFETFDLILHLMTGYNIVMHWPTWAMNALIIWKEATLQVFQLVGDLKAPRGSRVHLGLIDFADTFWQFFNWPISVMLYVTGK
jgi:hypothetical protein